MSANVVQLQRLFRQNSDWSPRELAEFYRVEAALIQAGLQIATERGVSDEGDPWFAFCRPDDAEVIVHIARIGGIYILAGPAYDGIASGRDIGALVRDLVSRHPLIQMRGGNRQGSKIFLHPAALLIAVVATAFFKSTEARALSDEHKNPEHRGGAVAIRAESAAVLESQKTIVMDAAQTAVILAAVAAVLQTPTSFPAEHGAPDPNTSTSDLLDFAALLPPAVHSMSSLWAPLGMEPHQFEGHQDVHAHGGTVVGTPAHPAFAEALPLIVLLSDMSSSSPVSNDTYRSDKTSAIPTGAPAEVPLQSALLTFKMALSHNANESLPVVQAAKVSYTQGATEETTTIPKPEQLSTVLVNALKEATHTSVDGQPATLSSSSFANAFLVSLTENSGEKATSNSLNPSTSPSVGGSSTSTTRTDDPTAKTTDEAKANDPITKTPSEKTLDLAAVLQDFFKHTSDWKLVNDGSTVVVYDTSALTHHPTELQSVTFDFSDGSTLSLVGLPATFAHSLVV
jgi:hypothetical protein